MTDEFPAVPLQALPTSIRWEFMALSNPEGATEVRVALSFSTPQGVSTFFLEKETAETMAAGLTRLLGEWPVAIEIPTMNVDDVLRSIKSQNGHGGKPG